MAIARESEQEFKNRFAEYSRSLDCVHCGLCIPFCPTHGITGREADSPRGRIYIMRGHAEGTRPLTPETLLHLERCIVCRACETVCPSGIRMGDMMESFRHEMLRAGKVGTIRRLLTRLFLEGLLPHRARIAALSDLLYLYQRLGLKRLVAAACRRLSPRLAALEHLQPEVPAPGDRRIETDRTRPEGYPARGKARIRVGLFLGCIASEWFAPVHRATIRVLQENGCDVVVPDGQTCCGALHRHAGMLEQAARLYARNAQVFSRARVDVVVVNAAGCGAALKEPPREVPGGLGRPSRDIAEFLDEIGIVPPAGRIERKVVYDQPCHLLHAQCVAGSVVERLLRSIPGLQLLPLADSDRCCGAGGIYNLLHSELAGPIGEEKAGAIRASGAEIAVTGNPGCALQIRAALRGSGIEVLHPVELLDRSYSAAP